MASKKVRRLFLVASIGLALAILGFFGIYATAVNSTPYAVARAFVVGHPAVADYVGIVTEANLGIFGYQVKQEGASGSAAFEINVEGSKKDATVYVSLRRDLGAWEVEHAVMEVDDENEGRIELSRRTAD